MDTVRSVGLITGVCGVLLCAVSVVFRLRGAYWLGGFELGTLSGSMPICCGPSALPSFNSPDKYCQPLLTRTLLRVTLTFGLENRLLFVN